MSHGLTTLFVVSTEARNLTVEAWITLPGLSDDTSLWEILRIRSGGQTRK